MTHSSADRQTDAAIEAARSGAADTLQALLDAGVSSLSCNDAGDSLLMLACYHAHPPLVDLLLARGADANACNHKGQHPLAGVSYKGLTDIVERLLEHGANPEGAPSAARSPLMYAAMYNHAATTAALLRAGASRERTTPDGLTALDLAQQMRAVHTIALLAPADDAQDNDQD